MNKQQFLDDVTHEINTLKKLATKEELAKLNFDVFDHTMTQSCIYGQITGHCSSVRAKDLMDKACIRVMNINKEQGRGGVQDLNNKSFSQIKCFINGKNEGQGWVNDGGSLTTWNNSRNFDHLSALEAYITLKGSKNKHIIQYMKGEVSTLKL